MDPQEKFIYEDMLPGVASRLCKHGKTQNSKFTSLVSDSISGLVDLLIIELRKATPTCTLMIEAMKPVFETKFADALKRTGVSTVDLAEVKTVLREPERVFMPAHPEADEQGFVFRAAVDENEEMVEMLEASRQYQNNVEVVSTLRSLMMRTISMGK